MGSNIKEVFSTMSGFITANHIPLFFDPTDGLPTSIDTGKPVYQCECYLTSGAMFCETLELCKKCDTLPKRVYMDLSSGALAVVDVNLA
jgi:hypothetical protein